MILGFRKPRRVQFVTRKLFPAEKVLCYCREKMCRDREIFSQFYYRTLFGFPSGELFVTRSWFIRVMIRKMASFSISADSLVTVRADDRVADHVTCHYLANISQIFANLSINARFSGVKSLDRRIITFWSILRRTPLRVESIISGIVTF